MTGIPVIPVMPDLPGESRIPGILLLTGITDDKQNKNDFVILISLHVHVLLLLLPSSIIIYYY